MSSGVANLQFYRRSELTVYLGWGSHVRPLKNVNASLVLAGLVWSRPALLLVDFC